MLTQKLTSYLSYLKEDRLYSDNWVQGSRYTLTNFLSWLNDRPLTTDTVSEYLRYKKSWKESTRNQHMMRIHEYAKWLKIPLEIRSVKEPVRITEALSPDALKRLLRGLESPERALVTFLCETGLRWSEVTSLVNSRNISQYIVTDPDGTWLRLVSKGNKERELPLTRAAAECIPSLPKIGASYVKRVRVTLREAGQRAGIREKIHPHLFRATFASYHLNVVGTDSAIVASWLGHANVNTMLKHYYKPNRAAFRKVSEHSMLRGQSHENLS